MYKTLWYLADMADRIACDAIMGDRARGEVRDIEAVARDAGQRLDPVSVEGQTMARQAVDWLGEVITGVPPRDPRQPMTAHRVAVSLALVAMALARTPRSGPGYRDTAATVAESMLAVIRHWGPNIPWSVVDERIDWYAEVLGDRFFPAAAPAAPAKQPAQPVSAPAAPAE